VWSSDYTARRRVALLFLPASPPHSREQDSRKTDGGSARESCRGPMRVLVATIMAPTGPTGRADARARGFVSILASRGDRPQIVTPILVGGPLSIPVFGARRAIDPVSGICKHRLVQVLALCVLKKALERELAFEGPCRRLRASASLSAKAADRGASRHVEKGRGGQPRPTGPKLEWGRQEDAPRSASPRVPVDSRPGTTSLTGSRWDRLRVGGGTQGMTGHVKGLDAIAVCCRVQLRLDTGSRFTTEQGRATSSQSAVSRSPRTTHICCTCSPKPNRKGQQLHARPRGRRSLPGVSSNSCRSRWAWKARSGSSAPRRRSQPAIRATGPMPTLRYGKSVHGDHRSHGMWVRSRCRRYRRDSRAVRRGTPKD